ncbi:protoheme IX farnesyltransferase [Zobellella endophytica]|uniref:Protoheme IX farnesyltransferase n=1 Tax=Zobellella endophytica TaxID=2116700 RepID=A0A2P7R2F7_9GAMM|nr:heme o synthase [Zobellella endophytica]PSJ44384.1 protoheme IX farnesyltransferase [Zobellella endophytica]
MIWPYLKVTKPGIIMGNLIAVAGGFCLAARGDIDPALLAATVLGLSLVVASGCAINNCIDRDIDARMERTRRRVTVTGELAPRTALIVGLVLGLLGFGLLAAATNPVALGFAAFGYGIYVGLYSLYMKRRSVYGTLVGSLSGAVPPVVGYCAVSGRFDPGAAILLLMFCLWQMPHSYAIAIFRLRDYQAARIPVLPVARGIHRARVHIVLYIALFCLVSALLPLAGYTGLTFMAVACATSLWWLALACWGWRRGMEVSGWARRVFVLSLITIVAVSLTMALDFRPGGELWALNPR